MKRYVWFTLSALSLMTVLSSTSFAQLWRPTSGPTGGMVNDIAADSSGRVWLVTGRAGCLMSDDHGANWQHVNWGLPWTNLLRVCPAKNGVVFAVSIDKKALYRLDTRVARPQWTWEVVTPDASGSLINDIATTITNDEVLVAYGGEGMFRSTDNGTSWKLFSDPLVKATAVCVASGAPGEYAIASIGAPSSITTVSVTSNGGVSWISIPKNVPDLTRPTSLVINNNHRILISKMHNDTRVPVFGGRIFYSSDTGWVKVYERAFESEDGKNHIDKMVKVNATGTLYANAHGPTIRSSDGGLTWTPKDPEKRGDEPFSVTVSADEQYLYASGEPDGVFGSTDQGMTWQEKNKGATTDKSILAHFIYGLAINSKQHLFSISEFSLDRSTDNGVTWDYSTEYGETYFPSIFIDKSDKIFIGYTWGLLRSTNNGNSFEKVIDVDNTTGSNTNIVLMTRQSGSGKLYAVSVDDRFGLQTSTTGGDSGSWVRNAALPTNVQPRAVGCSHDTVFVSGTSVDIYRSINDGVTWDQFTLPTQFAGIQEFIIHTDGSILGLIGSAQGSVIRSTNGGKDWNRIFPPADGSPVTDYFGMTHDDRGTVFVYTDSGVFRSDKTLAIWTNVSEGLNPGNYDPKKFINVAEIVQNPVNRHYYAGVRGLSVYESTPDLGVKSETNLPANNSTIENYPNPFSMSTMINFRLEDASVVTVDIFNTTGRRVSQILAGKLDAGTHTIPFDGAFLPSGNYMVVLRAGATTQTSWITLTR